MNPAHKEVLMPLPKPAHGYASLVEGFPAPILAEPRLPLPLPLNEGKSFGIALLDLRIGASPLPLGSEVLLRVYMSSRKLAFEMASRELGFFKLVVNFDDVAALMVTEDKEVCTFELISRREPAKHRGALLPYGQRDIMWTPIDNQPSQARLCSLAARGRSECLVEPLRFLIDHDISIKTAYQTAYNQYLINQGLMNPWANVNTKQEPGQAPPHPTMSHQPIPHQVPLPHQSIPHQVLPPHQAMSHPTMGYPPSAMPYTSSPPAKRSRVDSAPVPQVSPLDTLFPEVTNKLLLSHNRFKPTEFGAKRLRIGAWEKRSYFGGDLKVKFLYVKKRIVWEVIDVFGLAKIEICFKDIASVALKMEENDMVMVVEVSKLPFFYRGFPQKMKNTRWEHSPDITNGQASVTREHVIHLAKNVLFTHLETLFQSDPQLRRKTNFTPAILAAFGYNEKSPSESVPGPTRISHSIKPVSLTHSTSRPHLSCFCGSVCDKNTCSCAKESVWCDRQCGCDLTVCGNPANAKLSACARKAYINLQTQPSLIDLDQILRLPCKCNTASIRQLSTLRECFECGSQFYYSFCFGTIVPVGAIWHCDKCGVCRDSKEFHCNDCNKCSFSSADGSCRNCSPSTKLERSDCIIC